MERPDVNKDSEAPAIRGPDDEGIEARKAEGLPTAAETAGRESGKGCLYLCATPIGNLEDITLRVLRVLREVDLIAAEDTRRTRSLLSHFGIHTPLVSLHRFNEEQQAQWICQRLLQGQSVALVSDAGTPGISDPGSRLVQEAIARDIPVVVLPGPSAVVAALVVSGLDTRRFVFEGFLPRDHRGRRRVLRRLAQEERTMVFFEAPHRLQDTLADMLAAWGDRRCALVRELTKVFEEVLRTTLSQLRAEVTQRPRPGEMVLVVEGNPSIDRRDAEPASDDQDEAGQSAEGRGLAAEGVAVRELDRRTLVEAVARLMQEGKDKKAAVAEVARRYGLRKREVYQAAIALPSGIGDRTER